MSSHSSTPNTPHNSRRPLFYIHDQAKILAETYYDLGSNLYYSLLPKLIDIGPKQENVWRLNPAFVNLAFSCEISLKLLYESEKGDTVYGHKLYHDLFNKLSSETQNRLANQTINEINIHHNQTSQPYTLSDFYSDIKASENTFANERYAFEITPGVSHSLQCRFLLVFAHVLLIHSA